MTISGESETAAEKNKTKKINKKAAFCGFLLQIFWFGTKMPDKKNKSQPLAKNKFMQKKDIAWLFAVIILSVALVVCVVLGVTGYFSALTFLHSKSDLVIGETISIGIEPNQASVASFTFDGSFLPNENLPQTVQINALDLNTDVRVRVKAKIFGQEEEQTFDFITTDHFEKAEDGYYYFDDILHGGNKITFCNYIVTPKEATFYSGEKYVLTIIVETLESKYDENIWKKANI